MNLMSIGQYTVESHQKNDSQLDSSMFKLDLQEMEEVITR